MESTGSLLIDEIYEFSAPMFYDFIQEETEEEKRIAELWFESAISYAPSPVILKVKTGRQALLDSLCEFNEADQAPETSNLAETSSDPAAAVEMKLESSQRLTKPEPPMPVETSKRQFSSENSGILKGENHKSCGSKIPPEENSHKAAHKTPIEDNNSSKSADITPKDENSSQSEYASAQDISPQDENSDQSKYASAQGDVCTPKLPNVSAKRDQAVTLSKQRQRAQKIADLVKNPSALKSRTQSRLSQSKSLKQASVQRETNEKKAAVAGTPNLVQENQAIKRQKLDGGKTRQILNIKPKVFPHKSRPGLANNTACSSSATVNTCKEDRKILVREPPAPVKPFVSTAEMMMKFQSSTRGLSLPHNSVSNGKPMTLTRPKGPQFETSQRIRFTRMKSSAELEEEVMSKMPKFKARPLNKKILEGPTLTSVPRSIPKAPEFNEFHLETMSRASKNADTSSVVSFGSVRRTTNQWNPNHHTEPKTPVLQTSLRARPTMVKTSLEIEEEELAKIPKFKARPLNKKILESKGEMGLFCNTKKQVTIPQEFHFAIDERIPPPQPTQILDLFDKLSLNSGLKHNDHYIPRNTRPNPFHLNTEERGAEKERRFVTEEIHKQIEEERARIPKAKPYPYTTDYPVVPPRPERKQCTRPEPFQLESLVRHEEEMRREMEERLRKEREEAEMRAFKAQPVLKEDPIPLPEKERIPLTQVQAFNLHVEHRAVDRAEFDNKVKVKEVMYKRYREEADAAKMMEEEKALKQLRRTTVHHARPVPKFANPFIPQKSNKEATKAKSPKLRILQRRNHRGGYVSSSSFPSSAAPASIR